MMNVLQGNDVSVTWTITKCDDTAEDFNGADLSVFVVNGYERVPVEYTVNANVLSIRVPGNKLETGCYSLEAVWSKGDEWRRVKKRNVFLITDNPDAVNGICNSDE